MIEENGSEKQPDTHGYVKRSRACSEAKRVPFIECALARRLGAVPIPVFIATIVVLRYLESQSLTSGFVFDPPLLLLVLNTLFLFVIPFVVVYVSARSYLLNGSHDLLYLGCGLLVLGFTSPTAGSLIGLPGGANLSVTVYNTGLLATSILLFLGTISTRSEASDASTSRKLRLTVAYSGAVLFVGLFATAALQGVVPVFFVQGVGPTLLRQAVLGSAIVLFAVCSLQSARTYVRSRLSFTYWYALALGLISIGLSAVFLQSSVGSLVGWTGRSAQYLGGIYLPIAVLALRREIAAAGAPLHDALAPFFRESEKSYRALAEAAYDAIVSINPEGRVLLWNTAAERIFGWRRGEAVGSSLVELIIPDQQAETVRKWFEKSATSHSDVMLGKTMEMEAKRRGGSRIAVEVSVSARDPAAGNMVSVIIRDITERKQAENALREDERRFRHISSVISDITYSCVKPPDGSYSIDWIMGATERITGYSVEEIKAQGCWRFLVVDEDLSLFDKWVTGLAPSSAGFCELRLRHKSGDTVWVESSAECVMETENPERLRLYGGLIDVTERKRIENKQVALHRHATRLNSASTIDEVVKNTLDAMELTLGFDHADFALVEDRFVRIKGSKGMPVWPSELPLDGPSVVVKAANTGRTFRVPDTRKEPAFVEARAEPLGILSELTVPVLAGDQTVAVLNVESTRLHAFTEQDQTLLETLALHVSSALSRLKQMESLERQVFERTRKLAESERRFRELSDLLPQIVFEIDENGNVQYMNRAGFAAIGLSEEEFRRGLNAFHFLAPAEHDRVTRGIQRVMSGEMIGEREFTVLRRDGTSFPALVYTAPITRNGKTVGLRGIAIDITQHKRMEEQMRASKERLEYVVTSNPAVILTGKPHSDLKDFDTTYISRNVASVLGYEPKEFTDDPNFRERHTHPGDVPRVLSQLPRLFRDGHAAYEYRFLHRDGTYHWISEETTVTRDPAGNPREVIGYLIDITERKRMEEKARSIKEQLEYVITSNPAVIYAGRPRPDFSDFDATYVSRSVVSLLGFRSEDIIDRPGMWQAHVHPDDLRRYHAELPLLWKEGEHTFEYRFLHKDGNYLWIREEAKVILDPAGKPAEVIGYWTDISKEKQMDEIRDRFISAVTHELRTPLISISGYLNLVLAGESGPVSNEVKSNLEVVKRNADRLASLTGDLLDIQRLQSGKLQVNLQTIDFREIIKQATSEIEPFIRAKKLNFNVVVPRRPLLTLGDPVRLSQVLMNLLSNASKFTPEEGRIRLTVKDDKHMIVVKVADTGIGLRKEDLTRVFEPFAAIKKPTHIKGTGLGLSVTKSLVEAHGGKVWVESDGEGKGAAFTFTLPKQGMK